MKKILLALFLAVTVPFLPGIPVNQARADIAASSARDTYTGNGSTVAYTYTFKILTQSDIAVYVNGVLQTITTHYVVTGVGNDNGGTVVFVTAPPNGEQVLLLRNQPIQQGTSYQSGSISASTIERDFDRQTAVDQMQQEEINRSIRLPKTSPSVGSVDLLLPEPSANACIGWSSDASELANNECSGSGGAGSIDGGGAASRVALWLDADTLTSDSGITYDGTANSLTATTFAGALSGNASTATALAANGANCSAGQAPRGVDASGAAENCTTYLSQSDIDAVDFIVGATTPVLGSERVATTTSTVGVDIGTAGQAKWNVVADSIGPTQIDETGNYAFTGTIITSTTVASLGAATEGVFKVVTDANPDCLTGGGSTVRLCRGNGTTWDTIGGSGSVSSLDGAFDGGDEIDGANSADNAVKIGNGTVKWLLYCDGTNTCIIEPSAAANTQTRIMTDQTWSLYDVEGAANILTIDPDAGTALEIWGGSGSGIPAAYRPKGTAYFDAGGISVDGTNCTAPTEQALNSAEKVWAFGCADSNSSIFSGKVRMPDSYDGGTVNFTLSLYHATSESITFAGDFSAQCRAAGTAINSTYGTAIAADVAITTAHQVAEATTAAVTPNGTCAGGAFLLWRYVVDATNFSTNAANAKVLSVAMEFGRKALSD